MIAVESILTTHLEAEFPSIPARPTYRKPPARPFMMYEISDNDAIRNDSAPDIWNYNVDLILFAESYTAARPIIQQVQNSLVALEGTGGVSNGEDYNILYVRGFSTASDIDEEQGHFTLLNFSLTIEEVTT